MTNYEIYILIVCSIVFAMFTVLFSYMIATIVNQLIKLIKIGLEDERIIKEYNQPKSKPWKMFDKAISLFVCVTFIVAFGFSIYMNIIEDKRPGSGPSLKVVRSESMSYKNEANEYLFENEINNQINTFDIVWVHPIPEEKNISLYDIVVYKNREDYVIHRVVDIEEANDEHPEGRRFTLQGDAIPWADVGSVKYEQMQGIYLGAKIPFVGSFVLFLQSPAGWLCILLVLFSMFVMPRVEKKIQKEEEERLKVLEIIPKN